MKKEKIEGYWYSTTSPQYPKPIQGELSEVDSLLIYALMYRKEKECKKDVEWGVDLPRVMAYRGCSTSRITGEILGCREYLHSGFRWPIDMGRHYVLEHRVKPSDEFLDFIGFYDIKRELGSLSN